MSEAEFMGDGADYLEFYGEDCDGDCEHCITRARCEEYEKNALENMGQINLIWS